jgi:hypothetical protein
MSDISEFLPEVVGWADLVRAEGGGFDDPSPVLGVPGDGWSQKGEIVLTFYLPQRRVAYARMSSEQARQYASLLRLAADGEDGLLDDLFLLPAAEDFGR